MSANEIIALIDAEIATLKHARSLIAASGKKKPGRPINAAAAVKPKQKRTMSPETRAKIGAAAKARWAGLKKAGK